MRARLRSRPGALAGRRCAMCLLESPGPLGGGPCRAVPCVEQPPGDPSRPPQRRSAAPGSSLASSAPSALACDGQNDVLQRGRGAVERAHGRWQRGLRLCDPPRRPQHICGNSCHWPSPGRARPRDPGKLRYRWRECCSHRIRAAGRQGAFAGPDEGPLPAQIGDFQRGQKSSSR